MLRFHPLQTLHLVNTHGTRYEVDKSRVKELQPLMLQGRRRVRDFVAANLSALVAQGNNEFDGAAFAVVSVVK